jgi:branched-chain amino acid transport system ATP-binding protein
MALLRIEGLTAGYGAVRVLHDLSLEVEQGEIVTVVGANGAGKSTLLRTLSGMTDVAAGSITFDGRSIVDASPPEIGRAGIAHVPENRRVFPAIDVEDNLRLGAFVRKASRAEVDADVREMCERFPVLGERARQKAATLSGGEQQMLAIAMGLMARPRLMLLDEPSLGLAPIIVQRVFAVVAELAEAGITVLLVEQFAEAALGIADRGVVLQLGRTLAEGEAAALRSDESIRRAYLGT